MAARRPGVRIDPKHQEVTRAKIQASQLVNLLQNNALKGTKLDPVRQRSAEILLRKALPDLSATEVTGDVAHFVARLPEPAKTVEDWSASVEKPLLQVQDIASEPDNATVSHEDTEPSY